MIYIYMDQSLIDNYYNDDDDDVESTTSCVNDNNNFLQPRKYEDTSIIIGLALAHISSPNDEQTPQNQILPSKHG